jgi:hypothetical protein
VAEAQAQWGINKCVYGLRIACEFGVFVDLNRLHCSLQITLLPFRHGYLGCDATTISSMDLLFVVFGCPLTDMFAWMPPQAPCPSTQKQHESCFRAAFSAWPPR